MEILLLGIYSFFVWLIFIKLKLLPWTTPWKVAVAIFPGGHARDHHAAAEHLRADDDRREGRQVHRPDRVAGPGTRDRGPGREQPTGEEGRRAVPHRPDAVPERGPFARGTVARRGGEGRRRAGARVGGPGATDRCPVERASAARAAERRHGPGDVGVGVARAGPQACCAEHRARGRRRRQSFRSRAGADQRQRAVGAARGGAGSRVGNRRRSCRAASTATLRRWPRSGRRSPRRKDRCAWRRRRWKRRGRNSRTLAGTCCRRRSWRPATARWST